MNNFERNVIARMVQKGIDKPSIAQRMKNFSKEIGNWVKEGAEIVDPSSRLEICERCEHYKNGLCEACGCFMQAKARLATASCPIGKW